MGDSDFVPALPKKLLKFYDLFIKAFLHSTFKKIVRRFPENSLKILDIGCGTGALLKYAENHFKSLDTDIIPEFTGLDIDPDILDIAKNKLKDSKHIKLVKGSALSLPFNNQAFDTAASTLAIHHLRLTDRQKAFDEAFRVLKSGGSFFVLDFIPPQSLIGKVFFKIHEQIEDDPVCENLEGNFKNAGFKDIKVHFLKFGMLTLMEGKKIAKEKDRDIAQ